MKPAAIIFDVDGTLANVEDIRHHVLTRPKDFDAFHAESVNVPPHHWVVRAAQDWRDLGYGIVVVTARSEQWLYHTILWLHEHGVPYDELHMRPDRDQRPDYDVKRDILRTIQQRWDVRLAYDDNPAVLRLWDEEDIPTVRVPGWVEAGVSA